MIDDMIIVGYIVMGIILGVLGMLILYISKRKQENFDMMYMLLFLRRCATVETTVDIMEVRRKARFLLNDIFNEKCK